MIRELRAFLTRRLHAGGDNQGNVRNWNEIIDNSISALPSDFTNDFCRFAVADLNEAHYWKWLRRTRLPYRSLNYVHKKALEFFFSIELLDIKSVDIVLDAAGGESTYLDEVRRTSDCEELYLHDHIYFGLQTEPDGRVLVGGDIGQIALPTSSVTKISCHHAFEHFKEDKDIAFIREIGRLLRPSGRACIIPLFLVNRFTECWNIEHVGVFDADAELIIDETASIPGSINDGHFARFYDWEAFNRRILQTARQVNLDASIVACRLDGRDLPDMCRNFGSILNYPLRCMVLHKLQ